MDKNTVDVDPHPDYVDGFNQGYFLAHEIPQFATDMAKHMPDTERGAGFSQGVEQYSRDMDKERYRGLEKDFKENKGEVGVDRNSPENLKKNYSENTKDMGLESKDRLDSWLTDKEENKQDMGVDREPDKDRDDREPELD